MRELLFALITLSCMSIVCNAQEIKGPERFVVAPSENTLLTVASQPACPLSIEDAKLLLNVDTSWAFKFSYVLRNRSDKPIRSYTIYFWTSEGTGGTLAGRRLEVGTLEPGQITASEDRNANLVPLTAELRDKMKLGTPLKMVVILIVEEVEFADGSRFSNHETLKALQKYFEIGSLER